KISLYQHHLTKSHFLENFATEPPFLCSFFGFFNHVTRKINPLYFTQIKEELSNYRLKVVT
ncbi:TPA: hypothetical protein ACV5RA_002904, partial [Enterococcus faecium]